MHKPLWLIVVLVVGIVAVLIFSVATGSLPANALSPVACTMDAKLCPDGVTYVGRDGNNNCAWQKCPGEEETNCSPYVCANGATHPRCSDDGSVINYFAAPCHMDGGEVTACTQRECGESGIGMPNWTCPDDSVAGPVCERDADGICGWRVRDCPNDSGFPDVPTSHENSDAIFYVKSRGIVRGYDDGTYKPDTMINRAEFVKIIITANSREEDCINCSVPFFDVPSDAWYADYVILAHKWGFVGGDPGGTFRPASPINFAEAAKIIVKAFELEAVMTIPRCEGDCPWYRDYVLMLEMKGAIPTSIMRSGQSITRGEMAEMMYRLRMGSGGKPSRMYEELR